MFGIKRSSKSFSRSPIDLALEKTINADAANQRTGISSLTNSISARQQWAESHFLRMSVISNLFTELNMTKKEDITSALKQHNIKNDNMCLGQILDMIKANMNPFGTINPLFLFNIATGKSVSQKTEEFLLNISKIGEEERNKFILEYIEDPTRFNKSIKRQTIYSFATEAGTKNIKVGDGKNISACLVRDLFGSILFLSLECKVDMAEVLSYPLTPVSLSLSLVDGAMLKTKKSTLTSALEMKVTKRPPDILHETAINASFFLYLQYNLRSTFGQVAKVMLSNIMKAKGNVIHFIFDKWISPSSKDNERSDRTSVNTSFQVHHRRDQAID